MFSVTIKFSILSVVMLNVIMLNVVAPSKQPKKLVNRGYNLIYKLA